MRNLIRLLAARNRALVLTSALLFGGFQILISAIVTALDLDVLLGDVLSAAPPFFATLIGIVAGLYPAQRHMEVSPRLPL